jgi:hypothetical protein
MDINTSFTRSELAVVIADVRKYLPNVRLREAWVYKVGKDHWEFHFADYYWHGSADNAYDARTRGWTAYLRKIGVADYQ